MPQFILNEPGQNHPFYSLDDFARGYVEALFFTNGDTCDDDEDSLNELGVESLTVESVESIRRDCDAFQKQAGDILDDVTAGASPYDMQRAGNDFWFTRQGHGVGFWERRELKFDDRDYGDELSAIARRFGESYVEIGDDGLIHIR